MLRLQPVETEAGIDRDRRRFVARIGELLDDWAVVLDQVLERGRHRVDRRSLALEFLDVFAGDALHVGARPRLVPPDGQQRLHLFHGEAEVPRSAYEPQGMDVVVAVGA